MTPPIAGGGENLRAAIETFRLKGYDDLITLQLSRLATGAETFHLCV